MLFLLVGAVGEDGVHDEGALDGDEAAEAGVAAFEFLHNEAVFDVVEAGAAVAFEVGSEEAEAGEFGDEFGGKASVTVGVADEGEDAIVDELPGGLADEEFVGGEEGIDLEIVDASEGHEFMVAGLGEMSPRVVVARAGGIQWSDRLG